MGNRIIKNLNMKIFKISKKTPKNRRFFSVIPGCSPRRSTRDFIADISIPDQYIADISTIFPIFSQYSSHSIICSKSFRGRPISDILAKYRR